MWTLYVLNMHKKYNDNDNVAHWKIEKPQNV